ncbi:MAG: CpaE family protein [Methylomonas sp.]
MTYILVSDDVEKQRLEFTLGGNLKQANSAYELYDSIAQDPNEQLIVISQSINLEIAKEIAEHFRVTKPSLGVILVRNRLDVSTMSEAIKAGIREVISSEDASNLVAATKRSLAISNQLLNAAATPDSARSRGKVLIVFSAKGGCGKTTLSVNLAMALANYEKAKVALLDFDLQFGDVAISLQIDPKKTISDAISMQNSLDDFGVQSLMSHQGENLDVLLAPTNPTDIEFISTNLVDSLLNSLRNNYDYIVVDTPPAFTDVILKVFDQADRCYLLTTLDMPAIKNLSLVIDTLEAIKINRSKLEFVLNRSDQKVGLTQAEVEEMIGEKFSCVIPSSTEVSAAANRGVPLVLDQPKHPVSKAIIELASKTDDIYRPNTEIKRGFFRRFK